MRRAWIAAAWIGVGVLLYVFFVRISLSSPMNSGGANNALQAWDMLHGHLLLHGWVIGDASCYTFELPLYAVVELFFGLTGVIFHLVGALTYLIVVAFAVALACTNSRGPAMATRAGVVVAVLAAPNITDQGASILLGAPDHIGTSVFLLVSFLLIDRAPGRRFTPPLLAAILVAGQIGDATVLYVAVPAVLVVSAYRVLAARKLRTGDAAIAPAAMSVPLALLTRTVMLRFGAFAMVPPKTGISPVDLWPEHAVLTFRAIRTLFGAFGAVVPGPGSTGLAGAFGLVCLLAAAFGFAKVVWTWRTASRAEQLLCVAIVVNLAAYLFSTMPETYSSREVAAVLPCGAVLAARACVPGRIANATRAGLALATAALVALLPLSAGAAQRPVTPTAVPLAAWLEAHGLRYGIAGYWDASAVTLQSGNRVQIRAIIGIDARFFPCYWETEPSWYNPSQHDARFVIANTYGGFPNDHYTIAEIESFFGRPARIYWVAGRQIMVYRKNLLRKLGPPVVPSPTGKLQ